MPMPSRLKSFGAARCLLVVWGLFCLGWVIAGKKPWLTRAFENSGVKQVPVREYAAAGLWIGLAISGVVAVVLLLLHRWWGRAEAAPVLRPVPGDAGGTLATRWFYLAMGVILTFAVWQRWPAMSLSFWGDEGWMFCDFVHGKWQPTIKGGSPQDYLRFNTVDWDQAFFGDQSGNNHWLATLLQRGVLKVWQWAGGHPVWSFRESVVRLVSLAGGVGSLMALGGWLRWTGRPVGALVAVAFMALHPWHVRFSVEARGYSLMLLFFILTFWAMGKALRDGRKRDWLWFGLAQFFMMYSWKGGVYGLVFANAVLAVRLMWGPMQNPALRRVAVARWMAACLLGGMFFIPLAMPSQLQMRKSIEEVRRRAKPMETEWRLNTLGESLTGIPWVQQEAANPREISLERLASQQKWTWPAVAGVVLLLLLGWWRLWRQDRFLASVSAAVLVSGVVAAVHFKYGLRVELLTWYLLYNLPILALLFSSAITPRPESVPAWLPGRKSTGRSIAWGLTGALALSAFAALGAPMIQDFQRHPRENLKRAWKMTRAVHEKRGFREPSKIYTGWLWRHTFAYEPRGDMYVRTAETLHAKMELARKNDGEFYMIVGIRDLCDLICADVMKELKDPAKFDHLGTLWGVETLNTLDVYRMRKN
ncbi:MAG: hypothetical protein JWL81_603 [Verrucomicrobiales bacterium]|nr:hypothetical protein [Verrucomicrobiales bacterium]